MKCLLLGATLALISQLGQGQNTQPTNTKPQFVVGDPAPASARTPFNLPRETRSYRAAADFISKALGKAGYTELAWYVYEPAPHDLSGFALFTKLEQIDASAKALQDGNRYSLNNEPPQINNLLDYIRALLTPAPAGHYRVMAFYIFDPKLPRGPQQTGARIPVERQDAIFISGARFLPNEIADQRDPSTLRGIAYIYEYEKNADGVANVVNQSKHDAKQHLTAAGLGDLLNQ
jgi:hypothetical protein